MATTWLGRPLFYYPAVNSTNDTLNDMASEGLPAGTVLVADFQTQGKGRLNRRWDAPAGTSLLLSLLLRPDWPEERASWLMMVAGLSVVESIKTVADIAVKLKWPNDIVCDSNQNWAKIGGILLEGHFSGGRLQSTVLGIGLNVNIPPGQLPRAQIPATSLLAESGRPISRLNLLTELLRRLEVHYKSSADGQSPHRAWNDLLLNLGHEVRVSQAETGKSVVGIAEATDEWGALLVRDAQGILHKFSTGDATLGG